MSYLEIMKSPVLFVFLSLFWFPTFGQSIEEQINEDVWYPFVHTYNSFDADSFMSIHTADVVRVTRDGQNIQVGEEYARSVRGNCARGLENDARRSIEFTFKERIHSEDSGFEVGYYRVHYSDARGDAQQVFYGEFHVVLKKVDGKWKIAVDSDTSQEGTIGEEDFINGVPLPLRN